MWIKPVIIILLVALFISLGRGFYFLMKDQGKTKRTLNSLGIRIVLAASLLAVVTYGLVTGQLKSNAPWDAALQQAQEQQKSEE